MHLPQAEGLPPTLAQAMNQAADLPKPPAVIKGGRPATCVRTYVCRDRRTSKKRKARGGTVGKSWRARNAGQGMGKGHKRMQTAKTWGLERQNEELEYDAHVRMHLHENIRNSPKALT